LVISLTLEIQNLRKEIEQYKQTQLDNAKKEEVQECLKSLKEEVMQELLKYCKREN